MTERNLLAAMFAATPDEVEYAISRYNQDQRTLRGELSNPLRREFADMLGFMATCQQANSTEWMQSLCKRVNQCLSRLEDRDRLSYNPRTGKLDVITGAALMENMNESEATNH